MRWATKKTPSINPLWATSQKNNKKNPMQWPPPLSATVPLLLQLLQAAVMAVPARRREPSPGEDASSRPSGCRGGRAGGGRGWLREPRPGLEARRLQTHLWRVRQDSLRYRALPGCFHPPRAVFRLFFALTLQPLDELQLRTRRLSRLFFYGALQLLQHFLFGEHKDELHHGKTLGCFSTQVTWSFHTVNEDNGRKRQRPRARSLARSLCRHRRTAAPRFTHHDETTAFVQRHDGN